MCQWFHPSNHAVRSDIVPNRRTQFTVYRSSFKDNKFVRIFLNQKICKVEITRKDSSLSSLKINFQTFPFIAILILFYLYN